MSNQPASTPAALAEGDDGFTSGRPEVGLRRIFAVLAMAIGAVSILQSAAIPAISAIQNTFDTDAVGGAWVQTSLLLSAAICTPLLGRLADMYGKRQMLVLSLSLLAIGNVIAAVGQEFEILILGRVIQGGGAGIFPIGFALVRDYFPPERVRATIGFMSGLSGTGIAAGLAIGGIIAESASYHWIFWMGAALATIAAIGAWAFVPATRVTQRKRLDLRGALIFVIGILPLVFAISQVKTWGWTGARTLLLVFGGLAILAMWTRLERRTPNPFANIETMSTRPVAMTNVATWLTGIGMFGSFFMIPQIIQLPVSSGHGLGGTAATAGLLMVPGALTMLVMAQISAPVAVRFGSRIPLAVGGLAGAAGLVLLAFAHSTHFQVAFFTMIFFAGLGFVHSAMPNLIIDAVPRSQTGEATGFNVLVRQIGSAMGTQIAGAILATSAIGALGPTEAGFQTAFLVAAGVLTVAALVTLTIPKVPDNVHRLEALDQPL